METNASISTVIRDYRTATGLTHEQLAEILRAVRPETIARVENGDFNDMGPEVAFYITHGLRQAGLL